MINGETSSDGIQPSKWSYYRFNRKTCLMYDDTCLVVLAHVIYALYVVMCFG